ncbi:MAG: TetR/AcrR family transcriptional regulator [Acidimicrobiia bacterium]
MNGGPDPALRERILEGAYDCVARFGIAKTTVEDVAKQSGVSRATVYRVFPGGKDELLRAAVGWEMGRFFGRLAEAVAGAADFASLVEGGLTFAHAAVREHEVLQKVLVTEPERLLPLLTTEQERPLEFIAEFLLPYLEREQQAGRLVAGLDLTDAADYVARMILSLIASPGMWNLDDDGAVRDLVRNQLLVGILVESSDASSA